LGKQRSLSVPPDEMIDILDILHVSSYVWRAAKVFHPHWEHQEAFACDRWLRIFLPRRGSRSGRQSAANGH